MRSVFFFFFLFSFVKCDRCRRKKKSYSSRYHDSRDILAILLDDLDQRSQRFSSKSRFLHLDVRVLRLFHSESRRMENPSDSRLPRASASRHGVSERASGRPRMGKPKRRRIAERAECEINWCQPARRAASPHGRGKRRGKGEGEGEGEERGMGGRAG